MLLTVDASNRIGERVALRAMFAARKRVFVDLLKWDIPVLEGRFEVDQFDDGHARYIVLTDDSHNHLASARLLPTTRTLPERPSLRRTGRKWNAAGSRSTPSLC